jgi:Nitrile hydratase, alpha chain
MGRFVTCCTTSAVSLTPRPMRPEGTDGWTEDQLAAIVTRDTMIGVSLPRADWTADRSPAATRR